MDVVVNDPKTKCPISAAKGKVMDATRAMLSWGLLMLAIAIGVWDIWVVSSGRQDMTVSSVLHDWSLRHPILPLTLGILLGHVFWPVHVD